MKTLHYNVVFRLEPEGGYTAIVPSLPGCISFGKTLEEARVMVKDAIEGYIISLKKHNETIPDDTEGFVGSIEISHQVYA